MKTKNILTTLFFTFTVLNAVAQDPTFTQAYANPLSTNPAIMGANDFLKVAVNYKSQLPNISGGFTTSSLSTLYPVFLKDGNKKIDFGLNIQKEHAGAFDRLNVSFALGYRLQLSKSGNLSFALMGGYGQKTLNTALLSFDEQYVDGAYSAANPHNENFSYTIMAYGDIGFGAMWYYNPQKTESEGTINCYFGIAGYHLNAPKKSFVSSDYAMPRRYTCQAGIKIVGDKKIDILPNVRINLQGALQEIAPGVNVDYRVSEGIKLSVGSFFRLNGSAAMIVGLKYKGCSLAYSYDSYSNRGIKKYWPSAAAHQLALIYSYDLMKSKGSYTIDESPFSEF